MVVLEKTLESPLDSKGIKPVNLKGNHSWIFIGRTDAEAKTPVLWLPDVRSWLIGKDPDWCWERLKAGGEGDNRGWDDWMAYGLNGHEFEQTPGNSEGQESLACCSAWGCKKSNLTEQLSNNSLRDSNKKEKNGLKKTIYKWNGSNHQVFIDCCLSPGILEGSSSDMPDFRVH